MKTLIAYASYSGNTEEVAELIEGQCKEAGLLTELYRIGLEKEFVFYDHDLLFIGTFTWVSGATPEEVKDFVLQLGFKPEKVAVFGTGDTQFGGDDLFCHAATKLALFYDSNWEPLKVEQSPRGYQENYVKKWTMGVLDDVNATAKKGENAQSG